MTNDFSEILAELQTAGDEQERAALVMEFTLALLDPRLQAAVRDAAIPHWFDRDFLDFLLPEPLTDAEFRELTALSFVESFPGRGWNVHERTRKLLLGKIWGKHSDRYLERSRRALDYCQAQDQDDTSWRVETVYHWLTVEPEQGARELNNICVEWSNPPLFAYDKVESLLRVAREHMEADRLTPVVMNYFWYWQAKLDMEYSCYREAKQALLQIPLPLLGDRYLTANCLRSLGDVHLHLAELPQACGWNEEALRLYQKIGDPIGEANCLQALGDVHFRLCELPQARERYEEALRLYQKIGNPLGEANCLHGLGDVHFHLAELPQARGWYEEALRLYQKIGNRLGEANCLKAFGDLHFHLSELPQAHGRYEEALRLNQKIGDPLGEANCLHGLGDVHLRLSELPQAHGRYEEALRLYQKIGNPHGEANCLHGLGDVHLRLSELRQARDRYEAAQRIYQEISEPVGQADSLRVLGNLAVETGDFDAARRYFDAAIERFERIHCPEGVAETLEGIAGLHSAQGQEAEADEAWAQAADWYNRYGMPLRALECRHMAAASTQARNPADVFRPG